MINALYEWSYGAEAPDPANIPEDAHSAQDDRRPAAAPLALAPATEIEPPVHDSTRQMSADEISRLVLAAAAKLVGDAAPAGLSVPESLDPAQSREAAAQAAFIGALHAPKVGLANARLLGGGFTQHGQRYTIELLDGGKTGDVVAKLENLRAAWKVPYGSQVFATPNLLGNANEVVITRIDTDPLLQTPPSEPMPFASVSIKRPALMGHFEDGDRNLVNFLRQNVGVIGGSRSGKTMWLNHALRFFTACPDVIYWLIDVQGSGGLRVWAPTAGRTAWTVEDAADLFTAAKEIATVRAFDMGDRAETFLHGDDDSFDFSFDPTPQDPHLVIVGDEMSLLSDLADEIVEMGNTTSKSAVTMLYANQRDDAGTSGSAGIRRVFGRKVMLRCEESDVDRFYGRELRLAGWLPNLLTLQGCYYDLPLIDDPNPRPRRARTSNLSPAEIKETLRSAYGRRPVFPKSLTRRVSIAVQEETFAEALDGVAYQLLHREGVDRILPADLVARLGRRDRRTWGHLDVNGVAALMREHGRPAAESLRVPGASDDKKASYYRAKNLEDLQPIEGTLQ